MRSYRSSTALLVDHYAQRLQWYDDSRTAIMLPLLLSHASKTRDQLAHTLRALAPALERLSDVETHHLSALRQLWAVEGDVAILETVMAHNSVDMLMKRRLEYKLGMSSAYLSLERTERRYRALLAEHEAIGEQAHRVRGALEVLERLQAESETVTVLTAGQTGTLMRQLAASETRLDTTRRALCAARDAFYQSVRSERVAASAHALSSSLLSRHAALPPLPADAPGLSKGSRSPSPSDKGYFTQQASAIPTSAVAPLLHEKRKARQVLEGAVARFEADVQAHEALRVICWWTRGGLASVRALHASAVRSKMQRLERRRCEALGHCIATASAKIAYRVCKQSMAELSGARSLLAEIRQQQSAMPRATLTITLSVPLPAAARVEEAEGFAALSERVLEDVATWMGVADDRFALLSHSARPADEEASGSKGAKLHLCVEAALTKGATAAAHDGPSDSEPAVLGESVVEEWREGRYTDCRTRMHARRVYQHAYARVPAAPSHPQRRKAQRRWCEHLHWCRVRTCCAPVAARAG